jgi:protein-tyrosine phosphatase
VTTEHQTNQADEERRTAMRAASRRIDRVEPWLHVGGALPPEDFHRLRQAGVTHVVDLRQDHEVDASVEQLTDFGIERRQVPVANREAPTAAQVQEILEWFPADRDESSLYVHCQGGFGRAGTMTVGLLVQGGLSIAEAEQQVRAVRPEISINDEQRAWLETLEQLKTNG